MRNKLTNADRETIVPYNLEVVTRIQRRKATPPLVKLIERSSSGIKVVGNAHETLRPLPPSIFP
jgi:hypothetical protein